MRTRGGNVRYVYMGSRDHGYLDVTPWTAYPIGLLGRQPVFFAMTRVEKDVQEADVAPDGGSSGCVCPDG